MALNADVFRGVSPPDMLPLGSPVLQRKEGYREIYQAWLRFDMAARLVWNGGDDVYRAGQRDIAALYEYWVFFKLLDIVTSVFKLSASATDQLIQPTADGFGLMLKSGEQLGFDGVTFAGARPLHARFSYNRSFGRNSSPSMAGSWTERMRPDYTLSLWPADFLDHEAEAQELMVHVHFDAKYRIDSIEQLFDLDDEKLDARSTAADVADEKHKQRFGRYKRADLLKMHAYRDAIRRTQGAYVLYPGDLPKRWEGFHEILPGLGAFPIDQTRRRRHNAHSVYSRHCRARLQPRDRPRASELPPLPSTGSTDALRGSPQAAGERHKPPAPATLGGNTRADWLVQGQNAS